MRWRYWKGETTGTSNSSLRSLCVVSQRPEPLWRQGVGEEVVEGKAETGSDEALSAGGPRGRHHHFARFQVVTAPILLSLMFSTLLARSILSRHPLYGACSVPFPIYVSATGKDVAPMAADEA